AMKLKLNSNIIAYSLIVPGKDSDESENLFLFEKILGKIKNNMFIKKTFDNYQINNALNLFPQLDYPILDLSILPSIVLCSSVDENIRVILSGDGADEVFAGYQRIYDTFWRFLFVSLIPKFVKKILINYLPRKSKLKRYLFVKHPIEMRALLLGINKRYPNVYGNYIFNLRSIFKSIVQYEIDYYLPSVLEKIDAASMLSSLEVRVPFLSNNIINYMNTISLSNLIWQRSPKYHLKKLLEQNTSKKYAFINKKGFAFNDKNQCNKIIKILEDKNYPVLIENESKIKFLKNKSSYIRLLLLKHWLFGYRD
ncbi:asparagine synthase C-terminal domain-containing protein, partial [Prochlorococcus sp. AH-716-E17]|nr:asparagine synthase C-terminal domain-containing protein [Prochlorococcus sp. AH-716-E17]